MKEKTVVNDVIIRTLVHAAVRAFAELNAIRARDGVPYTRNGWKSDVDETYFSSVVDELDEAVMVATGKSAHCHPELLKCVFRDTELIAAHFRIGEKTANDVLSKIPNWEKFGWNALLYEVSLVLRDLDTY